MLTNDTIQKAIEFGAKQERERNDFMFGLGGPTISPISGSLPAALRVGDKAVMPAPRGLIEALKTTKAPKATKAVRAPRQSGVMASVEKELNASEGLSLDDLVEATGAKKGTVYATLMTLKKRGVVNYDGVIWSTATPATATNGHGSEITSEYA